VFVVDNNNNRIQVFDLNGTFLRKWGTLGSGDGQFNSPEGITIYNNEVFVVDNNNNRIQVFDLNGVYLRKWTDNFINGG
ncbi:6-bladed beta-propeller, partial [Enterococcus faecium]|uniref:6-bladed beta-propeller n=1 Tax=Enterococcus faecium TaxID=1352 RepID=UPI003DA0EE55